MQNQKVKCNICPNYTSWHVQQPDGSVIHVCNPCMMSGLIINEVIPNLSNAANIVCNNYKELLLENPKQANSLIYGTFMLASYLLG